MKNSITQITEKFIKNIGEIFKEAVLLQAQRICLMQRQAGTLRQTIEKYRERTGHYPTRALAENIYRNRDNLNFCKEHGIRLSVLVINIMMLKRRQKNICTKLLFPSTHEKENILLIYLLEPMFWQRITLSK